MKENNQRINEPKFIIPDDYKPVSYEVSEGIHLGHLHDYYWGTDEFGQRDLRLIFAVDDMPCDEFNYVVAATYRTEGQQEVLSSMLKNWLGTSLHLFQDEEGGVDFQRLIDTRHPVMLTVRFYNDGRHTTPFRSIKAMSPVRRARRGGKDPQPVRAIRRMEEALDRAA